jgi:hypothetical protein
MVVDSPHIHVHYFGTESTSSQQGFVDLEFCCHLCEVGLLLRVPDEIVALAFEKREPDPHIEEIKQDFIERHRACESRSKKHHKDKCSSSRKYLVYLEIQ